MRLEEKDAAGRLLKKTDLSTLYPAHGQRFEIGLYESPPERHPRKPFHQKAPFGRGIDAHRFEITQVEYDADGQPVRLGVNLDGSHEEYDHWERICVQCGEPGTD